MSPGAAAALADGASVPGTIPTTRLLPDLRGPAVTGVHFLFLPRRRPAGSSFSRPGARVDCRVVPRGRAMPRAGAAATMGVLTSPASSVSAHRAVPLSTPKKALMRAFDDGDEERWRCWSWWWSW